MAGAGGYPETRHRLMALALRARIRRQRVSGGAGRMPSAKAGASELLLSAVQSVC